MCSIAIGYRGIKGASVEERIQLHLIMLIVVTQLFMGGFLAEMLSRNAPNRNKYEISERLGFE